MKITMTRTNAQHYRAKAAELKAAAQEERDYLLRLDYEYIASVYLVLAEQIDSNPLVQFYRSRAKRFSSVRKYCNDADGRELR